MIKKFQNIEWRDEFTLGETEIDNQHQKIFSLINELIDKHNEDNISTIWFVNILTEFTKYAFKHFIVEEKFMVKINYSDYLAHKKEHNNYRIMIGKYNFNFPETKNSDKIELIKFLIDWWTDHITKSDLKLKEYINSK